MMGREEEPLFNTFGREKHIEINEDEVFNVLLNVSECFQLLHHSFVYNLDKSVLIVGDKSGGVIQSTTINYTTALKESYSKVLRDLKNYALNWVYGNDDDNCTDEEINQAPESPIIPNEVVNIAVNHCKMIIDANALHSSFQLWCVLKKMPLPFPSCLQLIPIYCTYWNTANGGSDTLTKLMDDCILHPPKAHTNCETVVFTCLVMLIFTLVHCLLQINTSKDNLQQLYSNLDNYHNATSQCMSFHQSIHLIKNR
jgi:hypothetical protein